MKTAERNTSTDAYATHTYSGSIVDVPVFSRTSSILSFELPSTTTTVGFLTRDPIGYASGRNLFRYLNCSPLRDIDPTGLIGEDCGKFVGCKGKRVIVRDGAIDAYPDGRMIDPLDGVRFEGGCGCLATGGTLVPDGLIENTIGAGLCTGIDEKAAKEILEKEKPNTKLGDCGCGEKCKVTGLKSVVIIRDIPPGDLTFEVYVKLSINKGCLVSSTPWAENQEPCKITIPQTVQDKFGTRTTSRLTLLFTQGSCQEIGP